MKDIRKYTITAPSATMTQIDVEITMEMLIDVTIKKTNHSLFSARMAADLSVKNGGTMINAEGLTSEAGTFVKNLKGTDCKSAPAIVGGRVKSIFLQTE